MFCFNHVPSHKREGTHFFWVSLIFFGLAHCQTKPDLPQYLAGTDTVELIFQDKKDTVTIRQKTFIKKIANQLAYQTPTLPTNAQKSVATLTFFRKNVHYTLLQGDLTANYQFFHFKQNGKQYVCEVGKEAQTIIRQARKYPTLLK